MVCCAEFIITVSVGSGKLYVNISVSVLSATETITIHAREVFPSSEVTTYVTSFVKLLDVTPLV